MSPRAYRCHGFAWRSNGRCDLGHHISAGAQTGQGEDVGLSGSSLSETASFQKYILGIVRFDLDRKFHVQRSL
jgi:hypothetical protein